MSLPRRERGLRSANLLNAVAGSSHGKRIGVTGSDTNVVIAGGLVAAPCGSPSHSAVLDEQPVGHQTSKARMKTTHLLILSPCFAFAACGGGGGSPSGPASTEDSQPPVEDAPAPLVRAPELGKGDHSSTSVVFTEIAGAAEKLATPRDLAFNPLRPDELWVLNLRDESAVIVHDASTSGRSAERRKDADASHFMAKPAALAFGADETSFGVPGTFASCGESHNTRDDTMPADNFMGPALWSSDLSIFAKKNPHGLGSHLDMLHNSPLCMGIAHQSANIYWTISGMSNAIVKYDFHRDHNVGNDDHSDGESYEYVRGLLKYVAGVPSHLAYRDADAALLIADTGNARIVQLDTTSGTKGAKLTSMEPMAAYFRMNDATLTDVVTAESGMLTSPSGLELRNELIYVSDNANGRISAFTAEGERVNWIETGLPPGSLGGMAFGPDEKLYFVDMLGDRVLRIDTKP